MRRADEIDGVAHRPRVRDAAGAQPNPPSPDALGARHRSGRRVRGVTDLLPQWFRGRAVADRGRTSGAIRSDNDVTAPFRPCAHTGSAESAARASVQFLFSAVA